MTFPAEVKKAVYDAQNGYCAGEGCLLRIHSIHHKLQNTKPNRKNYPLFLNSPMNAVGLCEVCHAQKPHLWRVTEREADVYEQWLENAGLTIAEGI